MPWVVKLGGSLHDVPQLRLWLSALAQHCQGKAVIVPGGGPFADQVRAAQRYWSFDDVTAHRMAMLGMEQFGLMMAALEPRLVLVRGLSEIRLALEAGQLPIWLPTDLISSDKAVPAVWDVTSDSIAYWLALRLRADALLLVKSARLPDGEYTVDKLRTLHLIDEAFGRLEDEVLEYVWIAHRDDSADLLAHGAWPDWGVRVLMKSA